MLAGSEAGAPAGSGQGLWRQRESHHRETSRALGGWPGHVLSPGDPELDMAHLHPGRSLQWKKHNPGSKGVFVLVYSIIHSRNTYRVPAAFPNHRQTWAVAPTSQASESRKGSSPPSPHDHGGGVAGLELRWSFCHRACSCWCLLHGGQNTGDPQFPEQNDVGSSPSWVC